MGMIFLGLMALCALAAFIGSIWCLVEIFKNGGVLWGLGSFFFFIPVGLIFIAMNFGDHFKKPLMLWIGGFIGVMVFGFLGGGSVPQP